MNLPHIIPSLIREEENVILNTSPLEFEILSMFNSMNVDFVKGLDGFTIHFLKFNWHIFKFDLINVVQNVFKGNHMANFFSSTSIILTARVNNPKVWSYYKPIT